MSSIQPKKYLELSEIDEITGIRMTRAIRAMRHLRNMPDMTVCSIDSQHFRIDASDGGIKIIRLKASQVMRIPSYLLDELIEQLLVFKTELLNNPADDNTATNT